MLDVREEVQRQAKEAWMNSRRRNTIIASVGSGKSKVALDIIKELNPESILLLTNAVTLRDSNWKAEFEKFGMEEYWNRVTSMTYQAAYKGVEGKFKLGIYDEIDFACTPEYSKTFELDCEYVLGLTGFSTQEKRDFLEMYFPVCYEITTEEMQKESLLNKSELIYVEFPLSMEKLIQQQMKKGGSFKVSENDQYNYWDKKFQQALLTKSTLEKKYRLLNVNYEQQKDWQAADWNFKFTATKRKNILHSLISSGRVVYELLRNIHSKPGNKVLIFSANTKQCERFPNPFHSKNEVATIDDLNAGRVDTLSVVKKIVRGQNLVGVNYLIRESYDGSEETFQQSHGRLLRLAPDQVAKYIILVPYCTAYIRQSNGAYKWQSIPTQAAKWAEKMTASFKIKDADVRYIRMESDYKLKDGIVI